MAKTPQNADEAPKDRWQGLPSLERMFREELDSLNVKLDAFMFTPPVAWMPRQYGFRLTYQDGTTKVGVTPWGVSTFPTILDMAKNP